MGGVCIVYRFYFASPYSEGSEARRNDKNERNRVQSEENQRGGLRQEYRRVFSVSHLNRFFSSHCGAPDGTVRFPFVPLPNIISFRVKMLLNPKTMKLMICQRFKTRCNSYQAVNCFGESIVGHQTPHR